MKIPFELRHQPTEAASALLIDREPARLLELSAQLGGWPTVHLVTGGFLVRLPQPSTTPWPGAIRLRNLAAHLFLPVDAVLVPTLLPDEVSGLTRQRGLVFLADGRVLAFDPAARVEPSDVLRIDSLPERNWCPLPEVPPLPLLRAVTLDLPTESIQTRLEAAGPPIGTDPEWKPSASSRAENRSTSDSQTGQRIGGWLAGLLSKLLRARTTTQGGSRAGGEPSWLGRQLQRLSTALSRSLSGISSNLQQRQAAALRRLLDLYNKGRVEEALRRSIPLGGEGGRGELDRGAELPTNDMRYSLGNLLGRAGNAAVWVGNEALFAQLQAAYHKAAREAEQRGDYLRAAVILGKLLNDWYAAAKLLSRVGLHRDAARIYLEKLNDRRSAAQAFEKAEDFDRALQLYRQNDQLVEAGDLLRRLGEIEQALAEYTRAAQKEAARGHYAAAGDLFAQRAERPDLAEPWFARGWDQGDKADAVQCLHRLLDLYTNPIRDDKLNDLLATIDGRLGRASAIGVYNHLARVAERLVPAWRERLRDQALLGLAGQLAQAGDLQQVQQIFGSNKVWQPALVRDAEAAIRRAEKRPSPSPRSERQQRLATHRGRLTAGCVARQTGCVLLGFADGTLIHFNPRTERLTRRMTPLSAPIVSLGCDDQGDTFVMLQNCSAEVYAQSCCTLSELSPPRRRIHLTGACGITSLCRYAGQSEVLLWDQTQYIRLGGDRLELWDAFTYPASEPVLAVRYATHGNDRRFIQVIYADQVVYQFQSPECAEEVWHLLGKRNPCAKSPEADWAEEPGLASDWLPDGRLQFVLCDRDGETHWGLLQQPRTIKTRYGLAYRYVVFYGVDLIAGIHRAWIDWIEKGQVVGSTGGNFADVVACYNSPLTRELILVTQKAELLRVGYRQ